MKPLSLNPNLDLDAQLEDLVHRAHRRSWNLGFEAGYKAARAIDRGDRLDPNLARYIADMLGDPDDE